MKRVTNTLRSLVRDFALFWQIRVPAWVTRVAASLPSSRTAQDGAVIACFFASVILLGSGLLG